MESLQYRKDNGKEPVEVVGCFCPVHKTELVLIGKRLLGCTGRITRNGKSWDCPHTQYTTSEKANS